MEEGKTRGVGSMAGKKISDLDDTILVEKFCLKDLSGRGSSLMGVQGGE